MSAFESDLLLEKINKLKEEQNPAFGKMTPQHMVEHLIFSIRFSNGKLPQNQLVTDEKAKAYKNIIIYSEQEIPIAFKAPMLTDDLPKLYFSSLREAQNALERELMDYKEYTKQNPNNKPINPKLGELSFEEWDIFHAKHFKHHLKQFDLN